jgi:hypothetical protein
LCTREREKRNEEEITRVRRGEEKGVRESNNEIWCGLSAEEEEGESCRCRNAAVVTVRK